MGRYCLYKWIILAVVLAAVLLLFGGCAPSRFSEAAGILADIDAGEGPSSLKNETPAPSRTPVHFVVDGRPYDGDVYTPGNGATAAMVLVPGVSPTGKNDARLVAFANTLARARFRVLVPDIVNLRELRVRPEDARAIADACLWLREQTQPDRPLGLTAVSYAVGPAVTALFAPDVGKRVDFVVAIGGYYDLTAVVTFFTTGAFRAAPTETWRRRPPSPYGKWVFVRSNLDRLSRPDDRALLLTIYLDTRLRDPAADVSRFVDGLGPEGRALHELLINEDPDRVSGLIEALPTAVVEDFHALDLKRRNLKSLWTRFVLIHGRDDPIIPETESIRLADALPQANTHLYLVDSLDHVNPKPVGLIDRLILMQAIYRILGFRNSDAG